MGSIAAVAVPMANLKSELSQLFSDTVVLKIWKTATKHLERKNPPEEFPETVPQSGPAYGRYLYRDAEFWTCGFFPGSLYCLLERSTKHPQSFLANGSNVDRDARKLLRQNLLNVCRDWARPLHQMANRTDTHDIGFIIEPALRRDFELTGDERSLRSILTAAENLASRYSENTKAIRSWDTFVNNRHFYTSKEDAFLVIIDSMCNLDLLYYAGHHFCSQGLIDIATTHAHTVRQTHLRPLPPTEGSMYPQFSTCHVADLCPRTGKIVKRLTAQGYSDPSTWARGQAWAILGYSQTYMWTKDEVFLTTACGLAEHFIHRLESAPACVGIRECKVGRYVPLWDFDAPVNEENPLRDSSAGVIAANGFLILSNALTATGDVAGAQRFFKYAVKIVKDTLALCYSSDSLKLVVQGDTGKVVAESTATTEAPFFEAILKCATANFNEDWGQRFSDHGLVYGDYYLLEFGNRLLNGGFC